MLNRASSDVIYDVQLIAFLQACSATKSDGGLLGMSLEDRDRITDGRPPATEELPPPMTLRARLGWVAGYLVFAFVFGGHTPRSIPGGPTLSVTGDILPATSAGLAILLSFVLLRHHSALVKTIAFALVAVGAVAFSLIVVDVVVFQVQPYQRGPRLGL